MEEEEKRKKTEDRGDAPNWRRVMYIYKSSNVRIRKKNRKEDILSYLYC
jgi:hypothetical protein